jgi:hypothetical protein
MGFSTLGAAALNRLKTFYNGDPYGTTNQGGMDNDGHRLNFIPSLRDLSLVGAEAATLVDQAAAAADKAMAAATGSPKALRVDADQTFTDGEKAMGQKNLGIVATLAAAVSKLGDTMTGPLQVVNAQPQLKFKNTPTSTGWGWLNHSDGRAYLQTYDKDGVYTGNILNIGPTGDVSIMGIGDLATRIEQRAQAYADSRVLRTGDTITGALYAQSFGVAKGYNGNGYGINSRDSAGKDFLLYNAGNLARIWEAGAGDVLRLGADGSLWTLQLGDLNARIEARASAFASAAGALAVQKSGDTMTGPLVMTNTSMMFNGASAYLDMVIGNVFRWRQLVDSSGNLIWRNGDNGANVFYWGTGGSLWTAQLGDLNARIEARGLAYQNVAINASVNKASGARQDISGDFLVSKTYPTLGMNYPNVFYSGWQVRENAYTYLMNQSNGDSLFWIGSDGSLATKQLGDINNRIESRASAFAADARQTAYNQCVSSLRMVFVGDQYVTYAYNRGMIEPYGASWVSGFSSILSSDQNDIIIGYIRWRQNQYYNPSVGGWVASYYA